MLIELLTFGAVLVIAGCLARLVRRIDDLKMQMTLAEQEDGVQHSITRRYLGRLGGDPGLVEPQIDAGTF
jgi:hypothetical protein